MLVKLNFDSEVLKLIRKVLEETPLFQVSDKFNLFIVHRAK